MNIIFPRWLVAFAYVTSIILGNIFVAVFGIGTLTLYNTNAPEQIFFSLTFPLGAIWIGLTFSMRDFVQRFWGHRDAWFWMIIATFVTYLFNKDVALASVVSFAVSESVDWIMFYLLRRKPLKYRLIVSNILSCPIDSILFVTIAFGVPWYAPAVWGQAIVKYVFGLLALPLIPAIEKFVEKISRKDLQNSETNLILLFKGNE